LVSKTEIYDYLINKIEKEGFKLVDENSCKDLRKICMTDLKLGDGHYGIVKKVFNQLLKEKNLSISGLNPSKTVGTLEFKVPPAPESTKQPEQAPAPESTKQPEQAPAKEKPVLTPEQVLKNNQEAFREIFGFVGDIYGQLGIIKGKPDMKIAEITEEDFKKRSGDYADRVGSFCFRHGFEIPMILEVLALAGTGIALFILPLINTFFMKTKEPKMDEKLKDVNSEVMVKPH